MDINDFKLELIKAQKRTFRYGFMFFFISSVIATLVIIFVGLSDRSGVIGICIVGLFVAIGLLMMFTSFRLIRKIKSGEHELIKAIENKHDYPNYVVWIYQWTMVTKQEMIEQQSRHSHLVIRDRNGKSLTFTPKSETQVLALISYLSSEFPKALVGFSEENRKLASKIVGKELK